MKARVLIVDDEDAVRSSLKMIFEYEGYDVLLAANGPVGLKLAEQESPDLATYRKVLGALAPGEPAWLYVFRPRQQTGFLTKIEVEKRP